MRKQDGAAITAADALLPELKGQGAAYFFQFAVGENPVSADDGTGSGMVSGLFQEGRVHEPRAEFHGRVVDFRADGELGFRGPDRGDAVPEAFVAGEAGQEVCIGIEHVFNHAPGEEFRHKVEDELESAVNFEELMVKPDLRRLGEAGDLAAQPAEGESVAFGFHGEDARENDRHNTGCAAAAPAHFTQNADTAEGAVPHIVPEPAPEASGYIFETCSLVEIHGEKRVGGKLAHELVDLPVHGQAVEQREVEGKLPVGAPQAEHFGEGGKRDGRGREPSCLTFLPEGQPHSFVDRLHEASELGMREGRGLDSQGKPGSFGQAVDAVQPVSAVAFESLRFAVTLFGQAVVAEGDFHLRQFCPASGVNLAEFVQKEADAVEVAEHEVKAEVQAADRIGKFGDFDTEVRPFVHSHDFVGHSRAHGLDFFFHLPAGKPPQIVAGNDVGRNFRENLLVLTVKDDRAQDGLAGDEFVPGLLIAVVIDILGFGLEVEVTADAAQGEAVAAAADPVSLLHIGEREGIAGVLRIRDKETGKGRIRFIFLFRLFGFSGRVRTEVMGKFLSHGLDCGTRGNLMRRDADFEVAADALEEVEADQGIHAEARQVDVIGDGILADAQESGYFLSQISAHPCEALIHGQGAHFFGEPAGGSFFSLLFTGFDPAPDLIEHGGAGRGPEEREHFVPVHARHDPSRGSAAHEGVEKGETCGCIEAFNALAADTVKYAEPHDRADFAPGAPVD